MGNKIVVYKSNTGLTKKYAEWIAAALDCEAIPLKQATRSRLAGFSTVIFGGPIHASRLQNLNRFLRLAAGQAGCQLVVFATGAAPMGDPTVKQYQDFAKRNPLMKGVPFFYCESGINLQAMHGLTRLMMKQIAATQAKQLDSTQAEEARQKAENGFDNSNQANIQPLVDYVRGLG